MLEKARSKPRARRTPRGTCCRGLHDARLFRATNTPQYPYIDFLKYDLIFQQGWDRLFKHNSWGWNVFL
jgi:hypothetical protein